MTYQDYEKLGFIDFKGQLINYISQRIQALQETIHNDMPETTYYVVLAKIDELQKLLEFAKTTKFTPADEIE